MDELPLSLIDLLSNAVITRHISPYLPVSALLALSAVNKSFHALVYLQPDVWRHLDLTAVRSTSIDAAPIDRGGVLWRAERMDEAITEDEFYAGPLRGIFSRLQSKHLLQYIQILLLDGLNVTADLVRDIVCEDRFSVRILSIRECKNLNQSKLQQVLRYAVRPTRACGTPKLRALYCFGRRDMPRLDGAKDVSTKPDYMASGITAVAGAQIGAQWNELSTAFLGTTLSYDDQARWYGRSGRVLKHTHSEWPDTLQACKGIISFDAVLCRGPRHDITQVSSTDFLPPKLATIALGPDGCETCGTSPEGPAICGSSDEFAVPILAPPPTHAATLRAAQRPETIKGQAPPLFLRCEDCLRGRWCERCSRWWCEACYDQVVPRTSANEPPPVSAESLRENGWDLTGQGPSIKVYSKLCVEHCYISEMMMSADGFWG